MLIGLKFGVLLRYFKIKRVLMNVLWYCWMSYLNFLRLIVVFLWWRVRLE